MSARGADRPLPGEGGEFRARLGRPARIGGIDYLNSRPLLEGLAALGGDVEVQNHVPSELARLLRAGALDAALVPVVEYFAGPTDYRIVPGISIASYGAVESIRFLHRGPLGALAQVGIDRSSLTSAALLRLLFAEEWAAGRRGPEFTGILPEEGLAAVAGGGSGLDGVLLIGDAALAARPAPGWEALDLGTAWTRATGLPFVYAFWVWRGPPIPGVALAFARARRFGEARVDAIVERGPLPAGFTAAEARRYLHQVIRYDFGPAEIEGLLLFRDRARARGLIEVRGEGGLRFLVAGPGASYAAEREGEPEGLAGSGGARP